jgi:hypothetical protein
MVRERGYLARWLSKSEQVALFFGGVAQNLRTNGSILSYYSLISILIPAMSHNIIIIKALQDFVWLKSQIVDKEA